MSVVLYRLAGVGLACVLVAPASAQLLARKDLSAATALVIAETAIATCKANGYQVSATVVGRNGEVVVLSHKLWLRRYSGDPHVLGKIIRAGMRNFTIIGVLSPDFQAFSFDSLQPEVELDSLRIHKYSHAKPNPLSMGNRAA